MDIPLLEPHAGNSRNDFSKRRVFRKKTPARRSLRLNHGVSPDGNIKTDNPDYSFVVRRI